MEGLVMIPITEESMRSINSAALVFGSVALVAALNGCGANGPNDGSTAEIASESEQALTCAFYSENFDDGIPNGGTYGAYKVAWCDTYIPTAQNTPLCMTGRTLRTNGSTIDPTIWVNKGGTSCTGVRIQYSYYQFANANATLQYVQSNDAAQVCERSGVFTTAAYHLPLQSCQQQSVLIPFGRYGGVYIRFEHGSGPNALWIDNVALTMEGCSC